MLIDFDSQSCGSYLLCKMNLEQLQKLITLLCKPDLRRLECTKKSAKNFNIFFSLQFMFISVYVTLCYGKKNQPKRSIRFGHR